MNCVSSVKQKKEMDEMLEWLKRKNREQDEWSNKYYVKLD
jgi:hypothetical protein